jgi:hypothetical protein
MHYSTESDPYQSFRLIDERELDGTCVNCRVLSATV